VDSDLTNETDESGAGEGLQSATPRTQVAPNGPTASRIREFIEACGRHPFATGLFALLGLTGLVFSVYSFAVDRSDSRQTSDHITAVADSIGSITRSIAEASPEARDRGIDVPISIDMENMDERLRDKSYLDNIVFSASHSVVGREMALPEAEAAMQGIRSTGRYSTSDPYYSFSVSSVANRGFVQIAPYLLVRVSHVEPISEQLAGFYFGERGGGAVLREFRATVFPKEGVQVAPMINSMEGGYVSNIDYISLEPGEVEEFLLTLEFIPGYYYDIRLGLQIKFNGINSVVWDANEFRRGIPLSEIPIYDFSSNQFNPKHHPDAEWTVSTSTNAARGLQRIGEDIDAYRRSRVFRFEMAGLEGPVTPTGMK
jgi:hypothetical protein